MTDKKQKQNKQRDMNILRKNKDKEKKYGLGVIESTIFGVGLGAIAFVSCTLENYMLGEIKDTPLEVGMLANFLYVPYVLYRVSESPHKPDLKDFLRDTAVYYISTQVGNALGSILAIYYSDPPQGLLKALNNLF